MNKKNILRIVPIVVERTQRLKSDRHIGRIPLLCKISKLILWSTLLCSLHHHKAFSQTPTTVIAQGSVIAPQMFFNKGTKTKEAPANIFAQWKHLLNNQSSFFDIAAFIENHGDWPALKGLQQKAEETLLYTDSDYNPNDPVSVDHVNQLIAFFKAHPPRTGNGQFIFARALLGVGDIDRAKREFYRLLTLFVVPENLLPHLNDYKRYLPFLWAYLQASNLLLEKRTTAVKALMPYLSAGEKERVNIRLGILAKDERAVARGYLLLQKPGNNQGVAFDLARHHVSFDTPEHDERAYTLMIKNRFLDEALHPMVFWKLRHKLARSLIKQGRHKDAYNVIKYHGYLIGREHNANQTPCDEDCANAFCTSAWVGVMHAGEALHALSELKEVEPVVKSPITKARIAYWIGRAHMALGQMPLAYDKFVHAAKWRSTFYGQVSASSLKMPEMAPYQALLNKQPQKVDSLLEEVLITKADRKAFEALDLVRVLRGVPEALSGAHADMLFTALSNIDEGMAFSQLVFHLAEELKGLSFAVLLSKKKHMMFKVAYPMLRPATRKATISRVVPHSQFGAYLPALVHAVIRRESAFDEKARSAADARGLMQLRPGTAQMEAKAAKRFGLSVPSGPLYDKVINVTLGTLQLDTVLTQFNGSLVAALAAYNAGPSAAKKWLKIYGDPSEPGVDIINWIESIPFWETRNYVQRVLENMMVYEQLLAIEDQAPVEMDLLKKIQA